MARKKKEEEEFVGPPVHKHRYVLSLQNKDNKNCYHDFDYGNTLIEVKAKAQEAADKNKRSVMIYDYEDIFNIRIIEPAIKEELEVKEVKPKTKKPIKIKRKK